MIDIATANKGQLRQEMRNVGLSYDGLNVDGMRAALTSHVAGEQPVAEVVQEVPAEQTDEELLAELDAKLDAPEVAEIVQVPEVASVAPVPPAVLAPVVPVARPTREEKHGVKMPATGTICRQIWDYCAADYSRGTMPNAKALRVWGAGRLDDTTMTVQFYRWRKFNGIVGRQA